MKRSFHAHVRRAGRRGWARTTWALAEDPLLLRFLFTRQLEFRAPERASFGSRYAVIPTCRDLETKQTDLWNGESVKRGKRHHRTRRLRYHLCHTPVVPRRTTASRCQVCQQITAQSKHIQSRKLIPTQSTPDVQFDARKAPPRADVSSPPFKKNIRGCLRRTEFKDDKMRR